MIGIAIQLGIGFPLASDFENVADNFYLLLEDNNALLLEDETLIELE